MEVEMVRLIQKECADALLDAGISVPLKEWRLPWAKKPVRFRVTMKRPRMRGLLLMTREYLKMGVEVSDPERLDREAGAAFVVEHTESVSRLLAYTVCWGYLSRHFLIGPTAWCLRNFVEWRYLMAAFRTFEHLLGTEDFMRIIRSVERANPTKLRLSRARKGS